VAHLPLPYIKQVLPVELHITLKTQDSVHRDAMKQVLSLGATLVRVTIMPFHSKHIALGRDRRVVMYVTPTRRSAKTFPIKRHDSLQTRDVSKESVETRISMDTILFLESIVHFDSYTRHVVLRAGKTCFADRSVPPT
jgi:hypothetical protein